MYSSWSCGLKASSRHGLLFHCSNIVKMFLTYCIYDEFIANITFRGPYMRDRHAKFVELAEARVNKTLKDIQLVGNLSNRSAYDFNDVEVRKIFNALQKALDLAKA